MITFFDFARCVVITGAAFFTLLKVRSLRRGSLSRGPWPNALLLSVPYSYQMRNFSIMTLFHTFCRARSLGQTPNNQKTSKTPTIYANNIPKGFLDGRVVYTVRIQRRSSESKVRISLRRGYSQRLGDRISPGGI